MTAPTMTVRLALVEIIGAISDAPSGSDEMMGRVFVYEHGCDVVARLRAELTVLAAVLEALEDPSRPEESPVDAVRRLRAEAERLTGPAGAEERLRERVEQVKELWADRTELRAEVERLTRERDAADGPPTVREVTECECGPGA